MKHVLSPAGRVQISPDVVARRLGDAGILVHLSSNRIFELNATGMRIWELLADGLDDETLSRTLSTEFNIDERDCSAEVRRLLDELQDAGLLR